MTKLNLKVSQRAKELFRDREEPMPGKQQKKEKIKVLRGKKQG